MSCWVRAVHLAQLLPAWQAAGAIAWARLYGGAWLCLPLPVCFTPNSAICIRLCPSAPSPSSTFSLPAERYATDVERTFCFAAGGYWRGKADSHDIDILVCLPPSMRHAVCITLLAKVRCVCLQFFSCFFFLTPC